MLRLLTSALFILAVIACGDSTSSTAPQDADAAASARAQGEYLPDGKALDRVPEQVKDIVNEQRSIDDVTGMIDPVCEMKISADTEHRHTHENVTYGFCSSGCQKAFTADPAKFLAALDE